MRFDTEMRDEGGERGKGKGKEEERGAYYLLL
jgi:hypothetical protein